MRSTTAVRRFVSPVVPVITLVERYANYLVFGAHVKDNKPLLSWPHLLMDIVGELFRSRLWSATSSIPSATFKVGNDFFGINIAPSEDPLCDQYIVGQLDGLGINHVRMDFSYCSVDAPAQRLLERVLATDREVLLNVFPPAEEARPMADCDDTAQRWREFVRAVFSQYHDKIAVFEIGNTPNRGRWSGFGHRDFLRAWQIAVEEARPFSIKLAGPNISDFEPLYNMLFLSVMKRKNQLPNIHTDNLFVERVIEPEAYDHRVLGRWMTKPLALNLIKKMRVLNDIGRRFGVPESFCTYNCWTVPRLNRWASDPEQKQADYLLRYLILAAASDSMKRVYWGPLISNRDGLIDCGGEGYPDIDNVSFYREVMGGHEGFRVRPAYIALRDIVESISDRVCVQAVSVENGINHFVFSKKSSSPGRNKDHDNKLASNTENFDLHITWCRDAQTIALSSIYSSQSLSSANLEYSNSDTLDGEKSDLNFINSDGSGLCYRPHVISETPLFLLVNPKLGRPDESMLNSLEADTQLMAVVDNKQALPISLSHWRGAIMLENGADINTVMDCLSPEAMQSSSVNKILRDTRNKLWTIDDCTHGLGVDCERETGENNPQLTVKLNRAKGIKKFTYRFTASKGQRHWNNASYMIRCGVNTPEPIAYFERYNNAGISENYYVCRYIDNTFSARDVFACFNRGEESFRGFSKREMFAKMAGFICNMHDKRIIHRDLSSGNLMMAMNNIDDIDLYMIDIGRAKIGFQNRLTPRQRFVDLMRICYKLTWPDRELFIEQYNLKHGSVVSKWWRLPLHYYEIKQRLKKSIKSKLKKKRKIVAS